MADKKHVWQDFRDERARSDAYIPRLSIQVKGNIGLNKAAFLALGAPEAVIFRFDENGRAFALRPAQKGEKGACLVRKQNAASSYVIGAKAFANFMKFPEKLQTFRPTVEGDMLIVDMDEVEDNGSDEA